MKKRKVKNKSLSTLILIPNLLTIVGVALLFIGLGLKSADQCAESCLKKSAIQTAQTAGAAVDSQLSDNLRLAGTLAAAESLQSDTASTAEKQAFLDDLRATDSESTEAKYYAADGSTTKGDSGAGKPFFEKAMQGEASISLLSANERYFFVSAPIMGNSKKAPSGVICLLIKRSALCAGLGNSTSAGDAGFLVRDGDGKTIAATGSRIQDDPDTILPASFGTAASGESYIRFSTHGTSLAAATALVSNADGWSVCAVLPASAYQPGVRQQAWISAVLLLILILAGYKLTKLSANAITAPVKIVLKRMIAFAGGDVLSPMPNIHSRAEEMWALRNAVMQAQENSAAIISDLTEILEKMAAGRLDFCSSSPEMYVGDYASLLMSLKKLKVSLNNSMNEILQVSEQVSCGASQVSGGSQELAIGATNQAGSIQALQTSIEAVSRRIKENAQDAQKAKTLSTNAGEIMRTSIADMEQAREAMEKISAASDNIGKVIKAVDGIAFQTNILALNAAVEAARAGTAGKGFAVVADEVRNLSQKSAEAAKSTTALLDESILAVNKGVALVNQTSSGFLDAEAQSGEVERLVEEISVHAQEEAEAISQITVGIEQVSAVVQTNSATSEESAAASEELSSLADALKELVAMFKLET